jgi:hypothetical protein
MSTFDGGRALIVGVAGYLDARLRISSNITIHEAEEVASSLKDEEIGAYAPSRVTLLKDPTKKELLDSLQMIVEETRVSKARTVFLDFVGHGVTGEDGLYYFTTKESVLKGKVIQTGSGVSAPELLDKLRQIETDKLLFVINSCFSGLIQPSLGPEPTAVTLGSPPTTTLSADILATGEGRAVISACRDTQLSYFKTDNTLTYFGEFLVKGLKGDGLPSAGGFIGLFELYQFIYQNVCDVVKSHGRTQEPVITLIKGIGRFPVALHPEAQSGKLGALDPSKLRTTSSTGVIQELPRTVVIQTAHHDAITSGSDTYTGPVTKLIDFGNAQITGPVTFRNVVQGDLVEFHNSIVAAAANATRPETLKKVLDDLLNEVSMLTNLAKGTVNDVRYALSQSKQAAEDGEKDRLLEKLGEAEQKLLNDANSSLASRKVSEAIARAKQQAALLDIPKH